MAEDRPREIQRRKQSVNAALLLRYFVQIQLESAAWVSRVFQNKNPHTG